MSDETAWVTDKAYPTPTENEPTQSGWYRTVDGNDWLLYSLYQGQWYAHALNGETTPCVWGYIDQAGDVEPVGGKQGIH